MLLLLNLVDLIGDLKHSVQKNIAIFYSSYCLCTVNDDYSFRHAPRVYVDGYSLCPEREIMEQTEPYYWLEPAISADMSAYLFAKAVYTAEMTQLYAHVQASQLSHAQRGYRATHLVVHLLPNPEEMASKSADLSAYLAALDQVVRPLSER